MSNILFLGDCVTVMRDKINDQSVDLTVTSPPYDNLRTYETKVQWNNKIWQAVIKELYRVTKEGGVVVWVVADATINGSETGTSFRQALYFMECGFKLHDTMIWQKNSIPKTHNRYEQNFEFMFVFVKGKLATFNPIKEKVLNYMKKHTRGKREKTAHTEKKSAANGSLKIAGNRYKEQKIHSNIFYYPVGFNNSSKDDLAFKHPAIFPEQLAADHIKSWSNVNEIVLDPFMGSGTTGKAALLLNRKFIGIEVIEEYFHIAQQRLSIVSNDLFIGA